MASNYKITTIKVPNMDKDIFLKVLSKGIFKKFDGKFIEENTIIFDDNLVEHIFNKLKNVSILGDLVEQLKWLR